MAKFEVLVTQVNDIEPIEGADAIEIAVINGYKSVVRKGQFKKYSPVVYLPENATLPQWLIVKLGLEGKLAGSSKDRIKAVKLRGVLSQGILYPASCSYGKHRDDYTIEVNGSIVEVPYEEDISEIMGIIKYEPVIPASLSGEVCNVGEENTLKYDIDDIKKHINVLQDSDIVTITEKIHGTFTCVAYVPTLNHEELSENGNVFTFSKGLGAKGLVMKMNEKNDNNTYVKNLKSLTKKESWVNQLKNAKHDLTQPIYVLGEIFGPIQDLTYGYKSPQFRVFDIYVGNPKQGKYLSYLQMKELCKKLNLETVPILYHGVYDKTVLENLTTGITTINSQEQIREGVVIKVDDREDKKLGRILLKSINPDYLIRKGNVTEFN